MKYIISVIFILCFYGLSFAQAPKCVSKAGLPDPSCSPGVVRTTDIQNICKTAASLYRPTKYEELKLKKQAMEAYGIPLTDFKKWILDHIIAIQDGGEGRDLKNVFLQTKYMAHKKDLAENFIHRQICSNPPKLSVSEGQTMLSTNWKKIKIK